MGIPSLTKKRLTLERVTRPAVLDDRGNPFADEEAIETRNSEPRPEPRTEVGIPSLTKKRLRQMNRLVRDNRDLVGIPSLMKKRFRLDSAGSEVIRGSFWEFLR